MGHTRRIKTCSSIREIHQYIPATIQHSESANSDHFSRHPSSQALPSPVPPQFLFRFRFYFLPFHPPIIPNSPPRTAETAKDPYPRGLGTGNCARVWNYGSRRRVGVSPWRVPIVGPRAARRGGCSSRDSVFCLMLCYAERSRVGRGRGRVVEGVELGWLGVCRG